MILFIGQCNMALGMESGLIRDYQLKSHSFHWPPGGLYSSPVKARLNSVRDDVSYGGWQTEFLNVLSDWIQVDMAVTHRVTAMLVQGSQSEDHYVTRFRITYSEAGITWQSYTDYNGVEKVKIGSSSY